jgi:hypothetical protein
LAKANGNIKDFPRNNRIENTLDNRYDDPMDIETIDWSATEESLWNQGFAVLGKILSDEECDELTTLYPQEKYFRSRINMERYRFGRGEYQYFAYPLPVLISSLRETLYTSLAPIANGWMKALNLPGDYPETHEEFLELCRAVGQTRPTPLMLRYTAGGYNCLHQDIYGDIVFPFQVIFSLSAPNKDFTGGELLLVEQRPRAQSIGHVLLPKKGEAVVITTRWRPVRGTRGFYRANIKHGVSTVHTGTRLTLGIIFHDAK